MNVGGPATLLAELVDVLPKDRFSHTLITGECESNEIDYLASHPFNSQVIKLKSFKRSVFFYGDIKSFVELVRLLRSLNPEIVHTHTSKAGVLGRLAAKIGAPKAKLIHTYHGHLLYGYFPKWKTKLIVLLEKFLALVTDAFVAVTDQVRHDLLEAGIGPADKWIVIHPGVSPRNYIEKNLAMKEFGIPREKFVILWLGRFTDIKNPMLALQIIASLPYEIRSIVHLVMGGAGELLSECQDFARDNQLPVSFTGWLQNIDTVLSAADLLMMTSRNEGMPVVIVEAALNAIPTISTDVGGVSEFISPEKTGYLISQEPIEYAELLHQIISAQSDNSIIGKNAKVLAQAEYSTTQYLKSHVKLYDRALTSHGKS